MTDKTTIRNKMYGNFVKKVSPSTGAAHSLLKAFVFGGATCIMGEILRNLLALAPSFDDNSAAVVSSVILVIVAIALTGAGVYDNIARHGGAGSFLPITGFANAMSSAAMEFRSEGLITGTAVKMFNVVGPVIVNGIVWSSVSGILVWLATAIFNI